MKVLSSVVLILLFFFFSVLSSFAQEEPVGTDTAELVVEEESSYVLPYPGMLPDNPFYFLKTLRDNVIGFLISDSMKKAEFDLLQADKKIASGIFLVNQKQSQELALVTIKEGQVFFDDAIEKTKQAGEQGLETSVFIETLSSAATKHEEELENLASQTGNDAFGEQAQISQSFVNEVSEIE